MFALFVALLMAGCGGEQEVAEKEAQGGNSSTSGETGGEAFTIRDLALEMLWCEPGAFEMGSPLSEADRGDDETRHTVTLTRGFWLGKHEVTQAQWEDVMGTSPSYFKGANLPVEQVSWNDAVSFCAKLTDRERKADRLPVGYAYRLPTEAQWEHACRAGTKTAFAFGDDLSSRQANFDGNYPYGGAAKGVYLEKTAPVGSYPANAWGFHDLHGNVYEWCQDWYGDYPSGSVRDPVGPPVGSARVFRGGSWGDFAQYLRSAFRLEFGPDFRLDGRGFRPSLRLDQGKAK
ncbi:MAG: formylglycine-generating enzyme family protein [Opitutales bacterium]